MPSLAWPGLRPEDEGRRHVGGGEQFPLVVPDLERSNLEVIAA